MIKSKISAGIITLAICFLWCGSVPGDAEAFWVFSSDSGEWSDPKKEASDTPDKQFLYAKSFFDNEDYGRSLDEFKKLSSHFPETRYAALGQFYQAVSFERLGDIVGASEAYQFLIDRYPYSEHVDEAVAREFELAERMMDGEGPSFMGIGMFSATDKAANLYKHIVRSAPYGPYGARAQYQLGHAYVKLGELAQAERAFQTVMDNYPNSPAASEAKYQIARVTYRSSLTEEYHMAKTEQAIQKFEGFAKTFPRSELAYEANEMISELRAKKAKNVYDIGSFYQERSRYPSARLYYRDVLNQFPDTIYAAEAKLRLTEIKDLEVPEPKGALQQLGEMPQQGIHALGKASKKLFGKAEAKKPKPVSKANTQSSKKSGGIFAGIAKVTDFIVKDVLLQRGGNQESEGEES